MGETAHQVIVYDRKREVMRVNCRNAEDAEFVGRVITRGTHWLFAVQSPLPGIQGGAGGFLKVG